MRFYAKFDICFEFPLESLKPILIVEHNLEMFYLNKSMVNLKLQLDITMITDCQKYRYRLRPGLHIIGYIFM